MDSTAALKIEKGGLSARRSILSSSPATGERLGEVKATPPEEARRIVAAAREGARQWVDMGFRARREIVRRANSVIYDQIDEIAAVISSETGKPRTEALLAELMPVLYGNRYFANNAGKILKEHSISMPLWRLIGKESTIRYEPWGVVGIISPWNYPFGIPMTQIAMALMAGNAVVLKPSSRVPLVGEKIREIWGASGLPDGVFSVIQGPGAIGETLVSEGVDRLIFTGSVSVGRRIGALAAERLIPTTLELGGKDPAIVMADADLDAATSGILWGAMTNAGQTCAGIERVYVERPVFEEFVHRIVEKARTLRVGPDCDYDADMGAMTTEGQLAIVSRQVEEAKAAGAQVLCGGEAVKTGKGRFYRPTILIDVDHTMSIMMEETFGPVLPVMAFDTADEAVRLANDSRFGLSASIWSADEDGAKELSVRLVAGTVTVNDSLYTYGLAETPWGGVKDSGIGRTHGREGLLEMVRSKHVSTDRFRRRKKPWWYPYDRDLYDGVKKGLSVLVDQGAGGSRWSALKDGIGLPFRKNL